MKPRECRLSPLFLAIWLGAGCAADRGGLDGPLGGGSDDSANDPSGQLPHTPAELGGMDGAGGLQVGLELDQSVFMQALWQDERFSYLVVNARAEDIELKLRRRTCIEYTCDLETQPLLATWQVPANSVQHFDAEELRGSPYPQVVQLGGATLGTVPAPRMPYITPLLPVVSNSGDLEGSINGAGPQLESSSVAVPGSTFTLLLVSPLPGQLLLRGRQAPSVIHWLQVSEVRSQRAAVQRMGDDFLLDIPESASDAEPVRVEVDVSVPASAEEQLVVGFSAFICYEGSVDACNSSGRLSRIFPLRTFE